MKSKQAYLAGAMEASPDKGENWRDKIKPELIKLGYTVFDPTDKENASEVCDNLKEYKKHGQWDKFMEVVNDIQERDKAAVLSSSLVILRWDTSIKSYGTSDELLVALDNKIPIYTVIYGNVTDESSWMICKLRKTKLFESFNKLIDELRSK